MKTLLLLFLLIPCNVFAMSPVWFIHGIPNAATEVKYNLKHNYRQELELSIIEYKKQTDKIEKAKHKIYVISNIRKCLVQYHLQGANNNRYYKYIHDMYHDYVSKKYQNWTMVTKLVKPYIRKAINPQKVKDAKKEKYRHIDRKPSRRFERQSHNRQKRRNSIRHKRKH